MNNNAYYFVKTQKCYLLELKTFMNIINLTTYEQCNFLKYVLILRFYLIIIYS